VIRIVRYRKERTMLTVTPAAAAAVSAILESTDLPEGAGLRVQLGTDADGERAIGIAVVPEPEPGDERVPAATEDDLFLAPELAGLLDHHVLDAEIDDQNVSFSIRPQSLNGGPN
jgi:Fe-S cluster assembly iron-binding protein IscA